MKQSEKSSESVCCFAFYGERTLETGIFAIFDWLRFVFALRSATDTVSSHRGVMCDVVCPSLQFHK